MYMTFYKRKNQQLPTIDFLSLLENPYQEVSEKYIPEDYHKVTYNIEYATAKRYWDKHQPNGFPGMPTPSFPVEDIPLHYDSFEIPKKKGSKELRQIDAPHKDLSYIQSRCKIYLEDTLKVKPHDAAHGYIEQRGIKTERQVHQNYESKWFLYLDFKNFFPAHNKEYCMRMMKNIYPFGVMLAEDDTADFLNYMVEYALLNDRLPQGSPLSPTLTNLLMMPIDTEITNVLRDFNRKNLYYTRYADDLTISCKYKFEPQKVIEAINLILDKFQTPFRLNTEKIKFGSSAGKNYHLGTIINKENKLKLGHKKNQKFRAMLYQFGLAYFVNDTPWELPKIEKMLGLVAYYKNIDPNYIDHVIQSYNNKFQADIIEFAQKKLSQSI